MNKKTINTAIFFTILYWILIYVLVIKKGLIFKELTAVNLVIIFAANLVLILLSKFLSPVFELILKITGRIGTLIFALITTLVFIFVLTPIALFKRLRGQELLKYKFEDDKNTYFEEWESSPNIKKQY